MTHDISDSATTRERAMGERLRAALTGSGLTQKQLGQELGRLLDEEPWGQSRVWKLLWCQMPVTVRMWEAAAQALGLTFEELTSQTHGNYLLVREDRERQLVLWLRRTNRLKALMIAIGLDTDVIIHDEHQDRDIA